MVKQFILSFCISLTCTFVHAANQFQVVTDFDDTIKITNVADKSDSLCNALFSKKVFVGMPELLQSYYRAGSPISVVSGGIIHFKPLVVSDLRSNFIFYDRLYLRHSLTQGVLDFKYSKLVELLGDFKLPMVLIGDDTQLDADAYMRFRERYPNYVSAIYIHKVSGRPLPLGVKTFYSAYEIAFNEHLEGRMGFAELENIADSILSAEFPSEIFPYNYVCPKSESDLAALSIMSWSNKKLFELTDNVIHHLVELCKSRN